MRIVSTLPMLCVASLTLFLWPQCSEAGGKCCSGTCGHVRVATVVTSTTDCTSCWAPCTSCWTPCVTAASSTSTTGSHEARLVLKCPKSASVKINDRATTSVGATRSYNLQFSEAKRDFTLVLTMKGKDGKPLEAIIRTPTVLPGDTITQTVESSAFQPASPKVEPVKISSSATSEAPQS